MLGREVTEAEWCRRREGPTTERSWGMLFNADKTGRTLEELIRSLGSMSGNLGGYTLACCGGAVAGVRFSGLVCGIRDAMASSSV